MGTCIFYIDESGTKGSHVNPVHPSKTPIFTLTGLAIPLDYWRALDRQYLILKTKFFKTEMQKSPLRREHWEVKGQQLCRAANKNNRRNEKYINALFKLISLYEGKLFACTTIKNLSKPINPTSLYTKSLQVLLERFNYFIEENKSLDSGIMIADRSSNAFDKQVAKSHMSYVFGHGTGKELTNMVEAPLFADSELSAGLQIVDNISSLVYSTVYDEKVRGLKGAFSYSHVSKYRTALMNLEFISKNKYDGHRKYGFRVVDLQKKTP